MKFENPFHQNHPYRKNLTIYILHILYKKSLGFPYKNEITANTQKLKQEKVNGNYCFYVKNCNSFYSLRDSYPHFKEFPVYYLEVIIEENRSIIMIEVQQNVCILQLGQHQLLSNNTYL